MSFLEESTNLDVLRSVAVLLVLIAHFLLRLGYTEDLPPWKNIISIGDLGVLMFFIHTSLVLVMSLRRLEKKGEGLAAPFYIRRIFRIYPLSILTVLLVIAFHIPSDFAGGFSPPQMGEVWSDLFLIQNVTKTGSVSVPLWSLPFEVQMYILLPFLYLLGKKVRRPMIIVALGLLVWLIDHKLGKRFVGYPSPLQFAPWFFMGIAVGFRSPVRWMSSKVYGWALIALVLGFLLVPIFIPSYLSGWVTWSLGIGFSFLLPGFREVKSSFVGRVSRTIAKYSYGIYLSHVPVMWFSMVVLHNQPFVVQMVVLAGLLVVIPVLLYHTVESPFISLGIRLASGGKRPVPLREPLTAAT